MAISGVSEGPGGLGAEVDSGADAPVLLGDDCAGADKTHDKPTNSTAMTRRWVAVGAIIPDSRRNPRAAAG